MYSLSLKRKGFRLMGLRFRPRGPRFRPVGLQLRTQGPRSRPVGPRFRPVGLRFRPQVHWSSVFVFLVFVFDTSGNFRNLKFLKERSVGCQKIYFKNRQFQLSVPFDFAPEVQEILSQWIAPLTPRILSFLKRNRNSQNCHKRTS